LTYVTNVDRNVEINFPITQVTATDSDDVTLGQITYLITSGNDESLFKLDLISGKNFLINTCFEAVE